MTAAVFVDANVIVYSRDPRNALKQSLAAAWLEHLWQERTGRTSMQALSEYYVTATRKLKPAIPAEEAWDDLQALLRWTPQTTDAQLLERARRVETRHRLSWWDAMIVAAAQMQDCSLLLSEDMHDGAVFEGVTVRSPFTLRVDEPRTGYAVRPASRPRHRAPGRPRGSNRALMRRRSYLEGPALKRWDSDILSQRITQEVACRAVAPRRYRAGVARTNVLALAELELRRCDGQQKR